jgi:hypothetical protein
MSSALQFKHASIHCRRGDVAALTAAFQEATGLVPCVFDWADDDVRLTGYGDNAAGETVYFVADQAETKCHAWTDTQHYPDAEDYLRRLLAKVCEAKR